LILDLPCIIGVGLGCNEMNTMQRVLVLALSFVWSSGIAEEGAAPTIPLDSVADLHICGGFRDAMFGNPVSAFTGMQLTEDKNNLKYYMRATEDFTIGAGQAQKIVYGFYKGVLSTIQIETKGFTNSKAVLRVLKEDYGEQDCVSTDPPSESCRWVGKCVDALYGENVITHDATIILSSVALKAKQSADEAEKTPKPAEELQRRGE
jgi:hypothetical protein